MIHSACLLLRAFTLLLLSVSACAEIASARSDAAHDGTAAEVGVEVGVGDAPDDMVPPPDRVAPDQVPVDDDGSPPLVQCNDVPLFDPVEVIAVDRTGVPPLIGGAFRDGTYALTRIERYRDGNPMTPPYTQVAYTLRVRGARIETVIRQTRTPAGMTPQFDTVWQNYIAQTPGPFDPRPARMLCPNPDTPLNVFFLYEQREDSFLQWWGSGLLLHLQRVGPP